MTSLPDIDHQKVANKLALKLAESLLQSTQLEVLAESIRDERDSATAERDNLKSQIPAE